MSAYSNYMPVFSIIKDLKEKYPDGENERFPEGWEKPIELYGCYRNNGVRSSFLTKRLGIIRLVIVTCIFYRYF